MIELYFVIISLYALLILGFWLRQYSIAALASMGLIVLGVYGIIEGLGGVNNFFTYGFSVITLAVGTYVLIRGAIELIEEVYQ